MNIGVAQVRGAMLYLCQTLPSISKITRDRYWLVCVGFLCTSKEIFPFFHFNKVSTNTSFSLLSTSIVKLMF